MVAYVRSLIFGKIRECSWKKRVVILTLCPLHLGGQQTPKPQKSALKLETPKGRMMCRFLRVDISGVDLKQTCFPARAPLPC